MSKNWTAALVLIVLILFVTLWGTSNAAEVSLPLQVARPTPPYPGPDMTPEAQVYRTYLNKVEIGTSPPVTESYYLTTIDNLPEKGCELGNYIWSLSGAQHSFVFLDFGYPMNFGQGIYETVLFG